SDDGPWPNGLQVPAVRATDAQRVVFGRDRTDVSVLAAVEASSAVPGMFQPKWIDGHPYVDGGVRSSTNADLLAGLDLAVIVAPMSRPGGRTIDRHARKALRTELRILRERGTPTIVIEGDDRIVELSKGFPRRRPDAAEALRSHARRVAERALG
ncbi:MAG: hypothetical protein HKN46_00750, partial [Acidimicrobiia bacterium]|nr:hypothetical protein [Acidimicrobiia bacterium]